MCGVYAQSCTAQNMSSGTSSLLRLNSRNAKLFRQFDPSNFFQGIGCKIWTKAPFKAVMGNRSFLIRFVCFVVASCFPGCCEFYVCFCVHRLVIVLCVMWPLSGDAVLLWQRIDYPTSIFTISRFCPYPFQPVTVPALSQPVGDVLSVVMTHFWQFCCLD
jgi:hypothetical protein